MIKKLTPLLGTVGPVLFTISFTTNGLLRSDYDPKHNYVSELSIGPHGWIQIVSFMFLGLCLLGFAAGIFKTIQDGKASRAGPILLSIIALCYFVSGPLVTDPSAMFDNQQSLQGFLHGIFGALVFALSPVCAFVYWLRFRIDPKWKHLQNWTLIAVIMMLATVVLMKIAQPQASPLNMWAGIIQRCSLLSFYAWVFTFALGLKAERADEG